MLNLEILNPEIDTTIVDKPTTNSSPQKEIGIMKPCSFNGDQRRVKEFIQECNIYLNINEDTYKTDKLKVAFVLSLMNEKEALQWKVHFINNLCLFCSKPRHKVLDCPTKLASSAKGRASTAASTPAQGKDSTTELKCYVPYHRSNSVSVST